MIDRQASSTKPIAYVHTTHTANVFTYGFLRKLWLNEAQELVKLTDAHSARPAVPIAPIDPHPQARKAAKEALMIAEERGTAALTVQRAVRRRQASKPTPHEIVQLEPCACV